LRSRKNLVEKMNPEIRDFLLEMGANGIYKCYRCGKCTSACPWFQVGTYDFPVFRFSLEAALGMIAAVPPIVFGIIIQKYLVRGLTFGAIKK